MGWWWFLIVRCFLTFTLLQEHLAFYPQSAEFNVIHKEKNKLEQFDSILRGSTEKIESDYFQLPVTEKEDPLYRERVYCYELYHNIRKLWPEESEYSLSGEVDKKNHPLIRGNGLDNKKPDMLIHIPGNMGGNYLVLEVKPITGTKKQLKKDLKTLTAFRRHAEYERAILLFYGSLEGEFTEVIQSLNSIEQADNELENLIQKDLIELWHHEAVGTQAVRHEW